jgi:hypothetical protein
MDDPTQTAVIDELRSSTGLEIEVIASTTSRIRGALEQLYRPHQPTESERHAPTASALEPSPIETAPIVGEPHVMKFDELDRLSDDLAPIHSDVVRANDNTSGPLSAGVYFTPLFAARHISSLLAPPWSSTIRGPNFLTASLEAFAWARRPSSTSSPSPLGGLDDEVAVAPLQLGAPWGILLSGERRCEGQLNG